MRSWMRAPVGSIANRPNDVVLVEIDARTLHALDRWPWSRAIHAELIRRLNQAQPRAVFYDVDFSVRSGDPAADAALASALAARDYPFFLPAFWQPAGAGSAGGYMLTRPLPEFERSTRIGLGERVAVARWAGARHRARRSVRRRCVRLDRFAARGAVRIRSRRRVSDRLRDIAERVQARVVSRRARRCHRHARRQRRCSSAQPRSNSATRFRYRCIARYPAW